MDLFIIRHAWAEERDDAAWPDDTKRPLTDKGRKRFDRMAKRLLDRGGLGAGVIATSPMVRCRQTAEILARRTGDAAMVVSREELLPGGDLESLLEWTRRQAEHSEQLAWVGHAPDVGRLAAAVIGRGGAQIDFAKGAIAAVRFDGPPAAGQGILRWLATAKVVGG